MDRTMVWKAEERDASEKLYKKLEALTIIYPASETMKNHLSDTMFLKPNPQAFFHMVHYLFWLLDPIEFRKRFYWPISDKRAEAAFRSASVEYLKHLSEKHHLQWSSSIKSYLVVMPGGMKFITFMLELIGFVVQEMIQVRGKQLSNFLSIESQLMEVTQSNLLRMRNQNSFLKEYSGSYIEEIDVQISLLRNHTLNINQQLLQIAHSMGIELDILTAEEFLDNFETFNSDKAYSKYCAPKKGIRLLETSLFELKNVLAQFSEKDINFVRDEIKHLIKELRQAYPMHIPTTSASNNVTLHILLAVFNCMHEAIEYSLFLGEQQFQMISIYKENRITENAELDNSMSTAMTIQQKLNNHIKIDKEKKEFKTPLRNNRNALSTSKSILLNSLLEKFISTPPLIHMQANGFCSNRLPLLEDNTKMLEQPLNSLFVSENERQTLNKLKTVNNVSELYSLNTTTNKSRIIDAMQLLRTIKKDSTLKSKSNTSNTPLQLNLSRVCKKYFNERMRNERQQRSMSEEPIAANFSQSMFDIKSLALRKVRDDSLKLLNLSTSPSGRLDVLFRDADLPKREINDETSLDTCVVEATELLQQTLNTIHLASNNNNDNISNQIYPRLLINGLAEEDALANISDSILKDISI